MTLKAFSINDKAGVDFTGTPFTGPSKSIVKPTQASMDKYPASRPLVTSRCRLIVVIFLEDRLSLARSDWAWVIIEYCAAKNIAIDIVHPKDGIIHIQRR